MNVAAIQFDIAWEDKPANHATVERVLEEARIDPGTYVLLPELTDTGFSFNLEQIVDDRSGAWAAGLARRLGIWVQHGFAQRGPDGKGRNCAAIIDPGGENLGVYRKVHPFSYSGETRHYTGGDTILVRRCDGVGVCPMICYDLRFPELWRFAALAGAEVFTLGANWPQPRQSHWRALVIARAIENQAYVVAVNRVGSDPSHRYVGGSLIVAPDGEVLAEAAGEAAVLTAELDPAALRRWRADFPALKDVRAELLGSMPLEGSQRST
jgi:predicted amidohydrolase